ncbi:MAG TPA: Gldg family protein [Planctomycetota bacterium]|nr:Gldg family protein [Planctomycetota bacterium]
MGVEKQGGLTRSYRFGILVNVLLILLLAGILAVGSVVLVRKLSFRHDLRFDLTSDQRYTLDPLTEALVRSVEAPVDVTYIWGFDDDLRSRVLDPMGRVRQDLLQTYYYPILHNTFVRIHEVLREWQAISPHFNVRILRDEEDPLAAETIAKELGLERKELLNHVHVRMATRSRRIPLNHLLEGMDWGFFPPVGMESPPRGPAAFRVHEELTGALKAVRAATSARVLMTTGLGSRFDFGTEDAAELERFFKSEGYEVLPTTLRPREELPVASTALLLSQPKGDLDPQILEVVLNYESRGGKILLLLDPTRPAAYDRLLEPYGVEAPAGQVVDRTHTRPGVSEQMLFSDDLMVGKHPIDAPLRRRVTLFLGTTRPLVLTGDGVPGSETSPLLRASRQALFVPATFDAKSGAVTFRQERLDPMPEPTLGLALERRLRESATARVVVIGSTDLATTQALRTGRIYGNQDLLRNSMSWLLDQRSNIGLTPRHELERRMMDPRRLSAPLLWVGIIALPGLFGLAAILVFFRRQKT